MLLSKEILYYDFGGFRLDVDQQRLFKDKIPIALTHKAYLTLLILVRNAGRIVEKEEIISEIWTDSFVEESNLSQYIYVLRKILGNDERDNPYIETITKRGFRFISPVKEISFERKSEASEAPASDSTAAGSQAFQVEEKLNGNGATHSPSLLHITKDQNKDLEDLLENSAAGNKKYSLQKKSSAEKKQAFFRLFLIVILVMGLVLIAGYVYKNRQSSSQASTVKTKSIAVLPFKTIGQESSNEKLGFGMADAIITRLGQAKQIPVRPTSSVAQFADDESVDSKAVGRQLKVDAVLEGTIQRDQENVRVSVSLINVENGAVLWADTFNEKFTNIFALQDSISNAVASSVSVSLAPQEKNIQRPTSQPEAYQAYLLGVYFWNKRTKEDLEKGVSNFQKAIDLDPNYAQAYAGLADCYNLLGYYDFADRKDMMAKGRVAAEKALALNDSLAEAHIAMAFVQDGMEKARPYLERAIEIAPYNSTARVRYGWNLLNVNNPETLKLTEKQMRLAQEYDPLSHVSNTALCEVLIFQRNYDEAIKYCEKSVELLPDVNRNRLILSEALFLKGRHEEAIAAAKTELEKGLDSDEAIGMLGYYYAKLGQRNEAEKIFTELESKIETKPRLLLHLILISYSLEKRDDAILYFKKAAEKRLLPYFIKLDPAWEEILKEPEVKKIFKPEY